MSWGQAYKAVLSHFVGNEPSDRRYQARARARIEQGDHPSAYPERVGFRFARMFSRE